MIKVALRTVWTRPVRSAVLSGGFGLSVAVMAGLLGVGDVILQQARAPQLEGGGHVVLAGTGGALPGAHYVLGGLLKAPRWNERVSVAAPFARQRLYLVREEGAPLPVQATAGVPGLERHLGDAETHAQPAWQDTAADRAWSEPDAETVLRRLDRFHAVPDVPRYAASWMEWLYFNGSAGDARFYVTFLAGAPGKDGRQPLGVRLQVHIDGREHSWWSATRVEPEALLATAPDLDVGGCRVRLVGRAYHIDLAFEGRRAEGDGKDRRLEGELRLEADPTRAAPPMTLRGAGGWLSGYVVPVFRGALSGELRWDGQVVSLDAGSGYHDHNWGFWEGVAWRWGQVSSAGLSIVYGRVLPPEEAADPQRAPAFLGVMDAGGPLVFSRSVRIHESGEGPRGAPGRIDVQASGPDLDLRLSFAVSEVVRTPWRPRDPGERHSGQDLLQMSGDWRVRGTLGANRVHFAARGSAETFR